MGFFEIGSHELFAWAGFEPRSSWSLPPEQLVLQAWAMAPGHKFLINNFKASYLLINKSSSGQLLACPGLPHLVLSPKWMSDRAESFLVMRLHFALREDTEWRARSSPCHVQVTCAGDQQSRPYRCKRAFYVHFTLDFGEPGFWQQVWMSSLVILWVLVGEKEVGDGCNLENGSGSVSFWVCIAGIEKVRCVGCAKVLGCSPQHW
jgi:hypothetical protein